MEKKRTYSLFRAVLAGGLVLALASGWAWASAAGNAPPGAAAAGEPTASDRVFRLDFAAIDIAATCWWDMKTTTGLAAEREPDFRNHTVYRGFVRDIAWAWDWTAGKVYLDANRNGDLTDDEEIVCEIRKSRFGYESQNHQRAAEVRLDKGELSFPYRLRMSGWRESSSETPRFDATIASGWLGTVELDGRKWTLAVCDDMDGEIGQTGDRMALGAGNRTTPESCGVAQRLFLADRLYEVAFEFAAPLSGTGPPTLVATFAETDAPMGGLRIEGEGPGLVFLTPENLQDKTPFAVLDFATPLCRAPIGVYRRFLVQLAGERPSATLVARNALQPEAGPGDSETAWRLRIEADTTETLRVGRPLKQDLQVFRRGRALTLFYGEPTGVGGETYTQETRTTESAPTFAIYKGDRQIASGRFEYG